MGSGKYYLETQNIKWNFLFNSNNPSFYWVNLWVNPPNKDNTTNFDQLL